MTCCVLDRHLINQRPDILITARVSRILKKRIEERRNEGVIRAKMERRGERARQRERGGREGGGRGGCGGGGGGGWIETNNHTAVQTVLGLRSNPLNIRERGLGGGEVGGEGWVGT